MPGSMNDPTGGWKGFHEGCVNDLPTEHVDSDEDDSDYIYSGSSEEEDEPLGTRIKSRRRPHEFNEDVDMTDLRFVIGIPHETSLKEL